MLKKALVLATVAGAVALAAPAFAETACVTAYVNVNGDELVNQTQCV